MRIPCSGSALEDEKRPILRSPCALARIRVYMYVVPRGTDGARDRVAGGGLAWDSLKLLRVKKVPYGAVYLTEP